MNDDSDDTENDDANDDDADECLSSMPLPSRKTRNSQIKESEALMVRVK